MRRHLGSGCLQSVLEVRVGVLPGALLVPKKMKHLVSRHLGSGGLKSVLEVHVGVLPGALLVPVRKIATQKLQALPFKKKSRSQTLR